MSSVTSFGAVLSRRNDALYVIGGLNAQNSPTRVMWTYDVGGDSWSSTTISQQTGPERVLAGAYSPGDNSLLVLDRPSGSSNVRLWRLPLPLSTDAIELMETWTSSAVFTCFGMAVDTEGEHVYVVCDRGQSGHAVLELDIYGGAVQRYVTDGAELEQTVLLGHEAGVSVLAIDENDVPGPVVHDMLDFAAPVARRPICASIENRRGQSFRRLQGSRSSQSPPPVVAANARLLRRTMPGSTAARVMLVSIRADPMPVRPSGCRLPASRSCRRTRGTRRRSGRSWR